MAPRAGTTQTLADYLVWGYWSDTGQRAHSFDTSSSNVITYNLSGISGAAQAMARDAFKAWEMVANVRFQEVTSGGKISFDDNGTSATSSVRYSGGETVSSEVLIGNSWLDRYGTGVGTYSFQTYIHEIGHSLGLGHGGNYPASGATYSTGTWTNDSWQQTVMSYLDQTENPNGDASWAHLVSPMMADILAIQKIYGVAQGGPTAGNTTYGPGGNTGTYLDGFFAGNRGSLAADAVTIFDVGGRDTINLSRDGHNQKVNLAPGTFSDVYGLRGNLGIATNTVIENLRTGAGNDDVRGNGASNTISLGGGNDEAQGRAGGDVISGGAGADRLSGGDGGDRLGGGAGNDLLWGGTGHDLLDGGDGSDRLEGGTGMDIFVFRGGTTVVTDFTNDVDTIRLDDRLWGGRTMTAADALSNFAHDGGDDVVFRFGSDTLRLKDVHSVNALLDDLVIV